MLSLIGIEITRICMQKLMKKTDLVIISVLMFIGVVSYYTWPKLFSEKGTLARIYHEQTLIAEIDLTKQPEGRIHIPDHPAVVVWMYSDGSIAFIDSDCPDKLCIKMGKIKMAGQSAACLPNHVIIRVYGSDDDSDIVVG
jgi:hypothetical protein